MKEEEEVGSRRQKALQRMKEPLQRVGHEMGKKGKEFDGWWRSLACKQWRSFVREIYDAKLLIKLKKGLDLPAMDPWGCDGSVLLDDTPTFTGEKTAAPNNGSIRAFEVVDEIKSKIEKECPGVVSCADILAIAARDSVKIRLLITGHTLSIMQLGGPKWDVKLGRRDSKTASFSAANNGVIPPPSSTLSNLINRFKAKGLSTKDMVALSGAHTIGKARCIIFRNRIYNDTNIDSSFAKTRQNKCPRTTGLPGDNKIARLDLQTPTAFDNYYYKNLIKQKGLLLSDQQLFNGGSTDSLVKKYSQDTETFYSDFVNAMIKMGDIQPLTGSSGEIRKNCRKMNN